MLVVCPSAVAAPRLPASGYFTVFAAACGSGADFQGLGHPDRIMTMFRPYQRMSDFVEDGVADAFLVVVVHIGTRQLDELTMKQAAAKHRLAIVESDCPMRQSVLVQEFTDCL